MSDFHDPDQCGGEFFARSSGLREENKKLRKALEFYAKEENYKQIFIASRGFSVSETLIDNGEKARKALAAESMV